MTPRAISGCSSVRTLRVKTGLVRAGHIIHTQNLWLRIWNWKLFSVDTRYTDWTALRGDNVVPRATEPYSPATAKARDCSPNERPRAIISGLIRVFVWSWKSVDFLLHQIHKQCRLPSLPRQSVQSQPLRPTIECNGTVGMNGFGLISHYKTQNKRYINATRRLVCVCFSVCAWIIFERKYIKKNPFVSGKKFRLHSGCTENNMRRATTPCFSPLPKDPKGKQPRSVSHTCIHV